MVERQILPWQTNNILNITKSLLFSWPYFILPSPPAQSPFPAFAPKDFPADVLSRDFLHTKIFFTDYLTKLPIITEYFIGEPKIFEDYWEFPLYFFYETHKKSQGVIQIKKDNDSFVVDFFQLGQLYE